MKIEFFNEAEKDIKKLFKGNKRKAQKVISEIKKIAAGEEVKNIKKLTGDPKERYRLKVDDYRVVFKIKENILNIYFVKSRQEVYKWLKNK